MVSTSGNTQVRDAICGHVAWKKKLAEGLDTGRFEKPSHEIARNDMCACGIWLNSLSQTGSPVSLKRMRMIHELHTRFHKIAGEIADLAERNNALKAKEVFESSRFKGVTNSLVINLNDWRADLESLSR